MSNPLYLYGIFPAPGPQNLVLEGLDKQPVHTQNLDGFVFLYSEAQQERYLSSRKNLLGHERVLEQAMEKGFRTLLPLQFGLTIQDWDTVKQQLIEPRGDALKALFDKLNGCREVSIKIFWERDRELEMLMVENTSLTQERDQLEGKVLSMDEVVRIGQAIEQGMSDRQQAIIDKFRQVLGAIALETLENPPMTDTMIYNAAYLIPWDSEPTFAQNVEQLDTDFEERLKIRYNNFTAPFNFARLE